VKWGDIWGYPKPPKNENVIDRSWKAKNAQRKQWKEEGVWEEKQQEIAKRQAERREDHIRQGLIDPLDDHKGAKKGKEGNKKEKRTSKN